jgi:hypothetical protein
VGYGLWNKVGWWPLLPAVLCFLLPSIALFSIFLNLFPVCSIKCWKWTLCHFMKTSYTFLPTWNYFDLEFFIFLPFPYWNSICPLKFSANAFKWVESVSQHHASFSSSLPNSPFITDLVHYDVISTLNIDNYIGFFSEFHWCGMAPMFYI